MPKKLRTLFFIIAVNFSSIFINVLWANDAIKILPKGTRAILDLRDLPSNSLSVYAVNIDTNEVILSWNSSTPMNPASVMKILTTAVALDRLGPTYRWHTDFYLNGSLDNETLDGDLIIKGFGDPYLTAEKIWGMLKDFRKRGVRNITGDLLLDDSHFSHPSYAPGVFDNEPLRTYNVGPNALMFNFKAIEFHVEVDIKNNRVNITQDPKLENLSIINKLIPIEGDCEGFQRGIRIVPNKVFNKLTFTGTFPDACKDFSLYRSMLSHNEYTYALFKDIWHQVGGEFSGNWRNIKFEALDEPFFSHDSETLAQVISNINKHSNNAMTRNLLLTLAAERYPLPATQKKGRMVIDEWLEDKALNRAGFDYDNGAGLSRHSRLTAEQIVEILLDVYKGPFMPEFMASLSLSGLDGTMLERFSDGELTGKLHVKTGMINHVSSIAGYLYSKDGKRFSFAIIQNFNDIHRGYGEEVQETLIRWLYDN
jgi:D-alanyl-D-alanine carboxypeptidase/D-alanyl-D-alanine-endopeptidase (penicillin-binding protein 4)